MNIHEYQAKAVLREFRVPVPRGIAAMSVDEAVKAANDLGGPVWGVTAEIHGGGRGLSQSTSQNVRESMSSEHWT